MNILNTLFFRIQLMELLHQTKNIDEFISEAGKLKTIGGVTDFQWDDIKTKGHELAPDNTLYKTT